MTVSGIDATYYMTKDLEASTKFYSELFGMEPTVNAPGMFTEYTFEGGESFGLYKSENFVLSGTAMFRVDDVAEFVKTAIAKGFTFHGNGFVDETPVCHMAFGVDPDGNHYMIHRRKE